ncbi:copper transporter [Gymnopilus junonius]|uniref:Copper transporter n=1 Tax=Gymnopilus junonius TaxID=109634 RepID=A0A9P5TS62_GYMJU|nr:copper transporter [Gymnopilus junonius]
MVFESHLHWSFQNEHVLLPTLVLDSTFGFLVACLLVIFICLSERFFTFLLDKQWVPRRFKLSRIPFALWRTGLYSAAMFLRLCYMLAAMTFHAGLIATIIVALSAAQFVIELKSLPEPRDLQRMSEPASEPLLSHGEQSLPLQSFKTGPRSKSKPEDIFIHPAESNIARADAVALEMGIAGETERVRAFSYLHAEPQWEIGKGKDLAREMLLGSHTKKSSHEHFHINSGSYSDSDLE